MWKPWKTWTVWRTGARGRCVDRGEELALHKIDAESTAYFNGPVGTVGKDRRVIHDSHGFSNCPEMHSLVLENRAIDEHRVWSDFEKDFQFSTGYGCYDGEYISVFFKKQSPVASRSCENKHLHATQTARHKMRSLQRRREAGMRCPSAEPSAEHFE